jgi:hypothetical protein
LCLVQLTSFNDRKELEQVSQLRVGSTVPYLADMVRLSLEEIFRVDDQSLKDVSHNMVLWQMILSREQQIALFKAYVTKIIKESLLKKSPRKAFLVFCSASDLDREVTNLAKLDSSWEKNLDYLSKTFCKVPTEVVHITTDDIQHFIEVSKYSLIE